MLKKATLLTSVIATLLAGCLDGKNPSQSPQQAESMLPASSELSLSGKVVLMGYMQNSTICLDQDKDFSCSDESISTTTDSGGVFNLTLSSTSDLEDSQIVAELVSGVSKDSMETNPITFNNVLSFNTDHLFLTEDNKWANLLIHETEEGYSDDVKGDGIIISGLTHYINVRVQNSIINDGYSLDSIITQDVLRSAISGVLSQIKETGNDPFKDLNWLANEALESGNEGSSLEYQKMQLKEAAYSRSWVEYYDFSSLSHNNLNDMLSAADNLGEQFAYAIDTLTPGAPHYPDLYTHYRNLLDAPGNFYSFAEVANADSLSNYGTDLGYSGVYRFKQYSSGSHTVIERIFGGGLGTVIKSAYTDNTSVVASLNTSDSEQALLAPIGLTDSTNIGLMNFDSFSQSGETYSAEMFGNTVTGTVYELNQTFVTSVIKAAFGLDGVGGANIFGTGDRIYYTINEYPVTLFKVSGTSTSDYATLTAVLEYLGVDVKETASGELFHRTTHSDTTEYVLSVEKVENGESDASLIDIGSINLYNISFNQSAMDKVLDYLTNSSSPANVVWPANTGTIDATSNLSFDKDSFLDAIFP